MRIVFWQNCISPHQMPYIIKLLNDSRVQEVVVVSDEVTSKERINMGWQQDITKEAETLKIFIHPEIDIVEKFLASLSVITPLFVDIIATPRPPRTFGSSSLFAYTLRPGLEIL